MCCNSPFGSDILRIRQLLHSSHNSHLRKQKTGTFQPLAWNTGLTACYSYRDPNGAQSVERYRQSADFLRQFAQSGSDFTGFIIGAVANASPLQTPKAKARTGDSQYFTKSTWEDCCEKLRQLLGATGQDLIELADALEKTINEGGICMVGGQPQLEKCTELESIITL